MALTRDYGAGAYGTGVFGEATTYQLDSASGSFALKGQPAALRLLHLNAGGYALAGQDAILKKGSKLQTAFASFGLAGNGGFLFCHVVGAGSGNFLLGETETQSLLGNIWADKSQDSATWSETSSPVDIWVPAVAAATAEWTAS